MSRFTKFARRLREGLFPPKLKAGKTHRYECIGGPMDGEHLHLHTPGTLTFSMNGQRGQYVLSDPNLIHSKILTWKETQ